MRGQSQESLARSSDFLEGGRLSQVNQRRSSLNAGPHFLLRLLPVLWNLYSVWSKNLGMSLNRKNALIILNSHLLCSCRSATQLQEYSNGVRLEPHLGINQNTQPAAGRQGSFLNNIFQLVCGSQKYILSEYINTPSILWIHRFISVGWWPSSKTKCLNSNLL